ncbi:Lrp/AsnC family transcriptional regulator [Oricola sp.]|uniref:siroheme decarboxylase subunit beta n=1 Tax=Oricola sp. TaxID=1979950 RepID=UPI003BA8996A
MQTEIHDIEGRLLNDFQRDVPVVPQPFEAIGAQIGLSENEVIERLGALSQRGAISRFGATCRPNTVAASTLAAVAAPQWGVEPVAAAINAHDGVNHSYLREHHWNIWFVATGPDRAHVDGVLASIERETGLRVLDLPLIEPFNIDLGFDLRGERAGMVHNRGKQPTREIGARDRCLMQALSSGLPLVPRPYAMLEQQCGLDEAEAIARTSRLVEDGFIARIGVIVRHRALGWRANAMVVWKLPPEDASRIGPEIAKVPGITLCYRRRAIPDIWPYTLYNMIHGRSREDALKVLDEARRLPGLKGVEHKVLFSLRCFKQTGALIDSKAKAKS